MATDICCLLVPSQEHLNKVDPSLLGKVPLSYFLGTLGMPGELWSCHNMACCMVVATC